MIRGATTTESQSERETSDTHTRHSIFLQATARAPSRRGSCSDLSPARRVRHGLRRASDLCPVPLSHWRLAPRGAPVRGCGVCDPGWGPPPRVVLPGATAPLRLPDGTWQRRYHYPPRRPHHVLAAQPQRVGVRIRLSGLWTERRAA